MYTVEFFFRFTAIFLFISQTVPKNCRLLTFGNNRLPVYPGFYAENENDRQYLTNSLQPANRPKNTNDGFQLNELTIPYAYAPSYYPYNVQMVAHTDSNFYFKPNNDAFFQFPHDHDTFRPTPIPVRNFYFPDHSVNHQFRIPSINPFNQSPKLIPSVNFHSFSTFKKKKVNQAELPAVGRNFNDFTEKTTNKNLEIHTNILHSSTRILFNDKLENKNEPTTTNLKSTIYPVNENNDEITVRILSDNEENKNKNEGTIVTTRPQKKLLNFLDTYENNSNTTERNVGKKRKCTGKERLKGQIKEWLDKNYESLLKKVKREHKNL